MQDCQRAHLAMIDRFKPAAQSFGHHRVFRGVTFPGPERLYLATRYALARHFVFFTPRFQVRLEPVVSTAMAAHVAEADHARTISLMHIVEFAAEFERAP